MAPRTGNISVTVRYSKPGTLPPIYLAGSFSEPAWQPQEMEYTAHGDSEYEYHKDVQLEEGVEYQYKFRIGEGDWWILNEDAPTVTDNAGNRNNLLAAPTHTEPVVETKKASHEEAMNSNTGPRTEEKASLPAATTKKANSEPIEETSAEVTTGGKIYAPALIVEKVGSEPRHGDDFGASSTVEQRDAHHLHAKDAEPDTVVVRGDTHTPELAHVAAEVADSAETLDRDQPTPPISDEDAGCIGLRRMSSTPIPEVAETAAEVADVAANLDEEQVSEHGLVPKASNHEDDEAELDSGASTPWEEKVPLFPHECPGPKDKVVKTYNQSPILNPRTPTPPKLIADDDIDYNDPSLKQFPTTKAGILAELRNLERRLPADDSLAEGIPPSPVDRHVARTDLSDPSPSILANASPSLDSITEEQELEQPFTPLTNAFKATSAPSEDFGTTSARVEDEAKAESAGLAIEEHEFRSGGEEGPQGSNIGEATEAKTKSVNHLPESDNKTKPNKNVRFGEVNPDSSIEIQNVHQPQEVKNVGGQARSVNVLESSTIATGYGGPDITLQPATPGSSTKTDSGKSTAINENGGSPVKFRKQQRPPSPAPDRPLTPTSIRSSRKDVKSRNFLKAFWHVVFVDWIGGLIMRLCGGGRHTLLAISALAIIAPAFYLYYTKPLL